jgi:hypothetical protein
LFQITINHSGLSLGEIEAINNLFSDYPIYEDKVDNDFEYASILEIEFIKYKDIAFFDFIPIEKWSILIEIIKNIKKRRGKKGLRFMIIITEEERSNYDDEKLEDIEGPAKEKSIYFNKAIFILNHKNDLDFIKGLERIEITIENLVEIQELQILKDESNSSKNNSTNKKNQNGSENDKVKSIIFTFNEINRKWIRFTDNKIDVKGR